MAASHIRPSVQYSLDIALRPFATFETFIHPEDNELLTVLKSLAKPCREPRQYFIWGTAQTGKSHLLQATCNQLAETDQHAIYIPCDEIPTLDFHILQDISRLDVVCIDDVDKVLGDKRWDQALFRFINEFREKNKSLVMTARVNPKAIHVSLPDLASRLVWGSVYRLNPLTDEQKKTAMQLYANVRGIDVPLEVCNYLIRHYPRELKKLVKVLDQLDEQSLAQQRKVTVPFVKLVLDNP